MTRKVIIKVLKELKEAAYMRSNLLVEDGREVSDIERARSEGYASAYDFCIMLLEQQKAQ